VITADKKSTAFSRAVTVNSWNSQMQPTTQINGSQKAKLILQKS
jgi:hypothetical protein